MRCESFVYCVEARRWKYCAGSHHARPLLWCPLLHDLNKSEIRESCGLLIMQGPRGLKSELVVRSKIQDSNFKASSKTSMFLTGQDAGKPLCMENGSRALCSTTAISHQLAQERYFMNVIQLTSLGVLRSQWLLCAVMWLAVVYFVAAGFKRLHTYLVTVSTL